MNDMFNGCSVSPSMDFMIIIRRCGRGLRIKSAWGASSVRYFVIQGFEPMTGRARVRYLGKVISICRKYGHVYILMRTGGGSSLPPSSLPSRPSSAWRAWCEALFTDDTEFCRASSIEQRKRIRQRTLKRRYGRISGRGLSEKSKL